MDFDEYAYKARKTAVYPGQGEQTGLMYAGLGCTGEAGEIADKIKKLWRDHDKPLTAAQAEEIFKEVGDNLWYLVAICDELSRLTGGYYTLNGAAISNIEKLQSRHDRGKLSGSGDNR